MSQGAWSVSRVTLLTFAVALGILSTALWVGAMPLDNDLLYADVARRMLRSHDYLNPNIHGVPFLDKPPAFYWSVAAAQSLLGDHAFALRLPAAVAAALIAAMLYRAVADRGLAPALAGCLLLLGMPLFVEYSRRVYMEAPVAACVLSALLCFDHAWRAQQSRARAWPSYAAAGALVGLGFMFKSLVGLFPVLAFAPFVLIETRGRALLDARFWGNALVCLAAALTVAAPWHAYQLATQRDVFLDFTWKLHVEEQLLSAQPWSTGPVWFYLEILATREPAMGLCIVCGLGWLALAALRRQTTTTLERLLGCSLVTMLLVLSLSETKKDLYLVPVAGPAAALFARALAAFWPKPSLRFVPLLAGLLALRSVFLFDPSSEALQGSAVLVPSARAARAATKPSDTLHVLDFMFMATQYYAERKAVTEWSDPRPARLTGHIPYIRYGKNMRFTPLHQALERMHVRGETWLLQAPQFASLAARLSDVKVIHRDRFVVVLQGR